jgi:hypothetical protein
LDVFNQQGYEGDEEREKRKGEEDSKREEIKQQIKENKKERIEKIDRGKIKNGNNIK